MGQLGKFVSPPSPPYKFCSGASSRLGFFFASHLISVRNTSPARFSLFSGLIYTLKARGRGPCPCLSQTLKEIHKCRTPPEARHRKSYMSEPARGQTWKMPSEACKLMQRNREWGGGWGQQETGLDRFCFPWVRFFP